MLSLQRAGGWLLGLGITMLALSLCMTTWIFIKLSTTDLLARQGRAPQVRSAVEEKLVITYDKHLKEDEEPELQPTTTSGTTLTSSSTPASFVELDELTRRCQAMQCPKKNQYSYWVRSGHRTNVGPIICFNRELVVSPKRPDTFSRGVNIVVVHGKMKTVMDYRSFDTFVSPDACLDLTQYLSINVPFKALVLIASFDDMAFCLCENAKKILTEFGSKLITDVKFRSNWVLVGESGLLTGHGIEKLEHKGELEFAPWTEVEGCTSVPFTTAYVPVSVDIGLEHSKCGVANCGFDELALHVYTGLQSTGKPKICVAGHHVVWPGVKGGRGFNLAVVEPLSKDVISVRHFDSYVTDSSNIDLFLEGITSDHLLIGVVHDEATNCLHPFTRNLFQQFGIDLVNQLKVRSVMYFVGQRGLRRSPYQEISHSDSARNWPAPIDKRLCLPAELGLQMPAQHVENVNHRSFCNKHSGYGDFCYVHHKNEPIAPVPSISIKSSSEKGDIPILVLSGLNHDALLKTLRSLIAVPSLTTSNVVVAHFRYFDEYGELARLFGFKNISLDSVETYSDFLATALETVWQTYSAAHYLIIIDEEVIVTESILEYMNKVLEIMQDDDLIGAASAWNPYGFPAFSSDPRAVYYVEDFVGMAVILTKKFYIQQMAGQMSECCSKRSWRGWFTASSVARQEQKGPFVFLMPEVSRADYYRKDTYHVSQEAAFLSPKQLWRTPGLITLDVRSLLDYQFFIKNNIKNAINVMELLHDFCWQGPEVRHTQDVPIPKELLTSRPASAEKPRLLIFRANASDDYSVLRKLLQCFGLSMPAASAMQRVPGLFTGLFRLSLNSKPFYFLSTASPYMSLFSSAKQSVRINIVNSDDV